MFDIAMTMLGQLIDLIPYILGLILIFEFCGSLLFNK